MSEVILEVRDGRLKLSNLAPERLIVLRKRSSLSSKMPSLETDTAVLLAATFICLVSSAMKIMRKPQYSTSFSSPRGTILSMMCSRMYGRESSVSVESSLSDIAPAMRFMYFCMYCQISLISTPVNRTGPVLPSRSASVYFVYLS